MPFAASFPAPIAKITVAAPVTASPPANNAGLGGSSCILCSNDTFSLIDFQTLGRRGNQRVRGGSQRHDNGIDVDIEFRSLYLYRASSSGSIRLAKLHANAADTLYPVILILENLYRVGQQIK